MSISSKYIQKIENSNLVKFKNIYFGNSKEKNVCFTLNTDKKYRIVEVSEDKVKVLDENTRTFMWITMEDLTILDREGRPLCDHANFVEAPDDGGDA